MSTMASEEDVEDKKFSTDHDPPVEPSPAGNDMFTKKYHAQKHTPKEYSMKETLLLAYQTLGIVYGDIGTSPLYVVSSTELENPTEEDLLGVLSLIFWTLTIIPLFKYVLVVLRADDNGEGGTFALYSYISRHINFKKKLSSMQTTLASDASMKHFTKGSAVKSKTKEFIERTQWAQSILTFIVLLGTCMVIGDGALTPATSVLSALAGVQTLSPKLTTDVVVGIAVALILILFAFQSSGTSKVGSSFSPIMLLWFGSNVIIGIYNIVHYNPSVLKALSPLYILKFFKNQGSSGYEILGAVFLCTTGGEAMFADMGHFNKQSIQLTFCIFVYPSLVLSYAGEIAYLTKNPGDVGKAFYANIPTLVYWPMFIIATLAAIVASQSMISATFSVIKQSVSLGCFPRVKITHTSTKVEGQVYSPEINFILMVICVALVIKFKQGVEIGNAYGVAVIWVMMITTCLVTLVMLVIWDTNIFLILAFFIPYLIIEGIFMLSLLNKIPQGGWVPFVIASFFLIIMLSWSSGRVKKTVYDSKRKMTISELNKTLNSGILPRPPGICFFCTDLINGIPPIIRHYIQSTSSLREITVIITIRTLFITTVLPEERLDVGRLGIDGVYRCLVQFGYMDKQSLEGNEIVDSILAKIQEIAETPEESYKLKSALDKGYVFVTGRTILKANRSNNLYSRINIDYLYSFLQKNSRTSIDSLRIPPSKLLQVGMLYEI